MTERFFDIAVNTVLFDDDAAPRLERARNARVAAMLVLGTDLDDSERALAAALAHPESCVATAGVHPHRAAAAPDDLQERLAALLEGPHAGSLRAVGETGLDFNRDYSPRPAQERVFTAQLEVAAALGRTLYVHDRDSDGRTADLLERYPAVLPRTIVHCFTGTRRDLDRWLELDVTLGVTGWICDERRGQTLRELVALIPEDRLVLETDSPYLAPRNRRPRPRRNEPAFLPWIAEEVARCRGVSTAQLATQTWRNAERLLGTPVGYRDSSAGGPPDDPQAAVSAAP